MLYHVVVKHCSSSRAIVKQEFRDPRCLFEIYRYFICAAVYSG